MVQSPENRGNSDTTYGPASVGKILADPNTTFSTLLQQARSLACMESLLANHTGKELAAQFQVAAQRQDRLVLLAPSATWATRLRMQSGQMLEFLHSAGFANIKYIDIRIAPLGRSAPETPGRKHTSAAAELALDQMRSLVGRQGDDS